MSRSLNKIMLIGNLGQDPEVRSTTSGKRVANISVATSREWTGQTGEKQEKTEWHRCIIWNGRGDTGLADVVEKYCKKGDRVYVEGSVEYRQWQDKENNTRYTTEINVRDLVMLGSPSGGGERTYTAPSKFTDGPEKSAQPAKPDHSGDFEDFPAALEDDDSDLPF